MSIRPRMVWQRTRDSLWFVPGLLTAGAVVLAFVLLRVDIVAWLGRDAATEVWWLFGGSAESARAVLSTIAASVITVAGVVFSITIVALQLASTQFTPRVLQNFMSDRGNQLVLGAFIGTFTYTLLVLRVVRSADEAGAGAFVPAAAVTTSVVLALVSMGFLIYYLDHITKWIEASSIIDRVTNDTLHQIRKRFPIAFMDEHEYADMRAPRRAVQMGASSPVDEEARAEHGAAVLLAYKSGYVQLTDDERIFDLAVRYDVVVHVSHAVGDFVLEGTPLVSVDPRDRVDDEIERALRESIAIGHRRTISQDPELGIIQLSDIAVKALSPSINDPTTAMLAIDRLTQIIAEFGARFPRDRVQRQDDGRIRVLRPAFDFEAAVEVAFQQVRRYGARDAAIMTHLALALARIGPRVGRSERNVLRRILVDIEQGVPSEIRHEGDRRRIAQTVSIARRRLAEPHERDDG